MGYKPQAESCYSYRTITALLGIRMSEILLGLLRVQYLLVVLTLGIGTEDSMDWAGFT